MSYPVWSAIGLWFLLKYQKMPTYFTPEVNLKDLLAALQQVMKRAVLLSKHEIQREPLSVRERMGQVLL